MILFAAFCERISYRLRGVQDALLMRRCASLISWSAHRRGDEIASQACPQPTHTHVHALESTPASSHIPHLRLYLLPDLNPLDLAHSLSTFMILCASPRAHRNHPHSTQCASSCTTLQPVPTSSTLTPPEALPEQRGLFGQDPRP